MDSDSVSRRRFLAVAGATAGLAGCNAPTAEQTQPETRGSSPNEQPSVATNQPEGTSKYAEVYNEAIDGVVLVRVTDADARSGQGSGFIYDGGYVVTNEHVVGDASEVMVRFSDRSWESATVLGTDVYSDLAVLEPASLPDSATSLPLMEGNIAVGEEVLAIGNPFGLSGSLSTGIVSGVGRAIPASSQRGDGPNFSIANAIQTDAAVNPGNSGGPLMNLDGQVAGVVNSGGGDNIAFAISAPLIRRVVPALIEDGAYEHSYMGVQLTSVTPLIAEANDLDSATGVYIDDILDGGPSDGVLQGSTGEETVEGNTVPVGGDVVVSMDGNDIPSRQELSTYLALATSPGDTIDVGIIRDGSRQTVELPLGRRPAPDA